MKFKTVVGNPPYQIKKNSEIVTIYKSIYPSFMEEAYKVGNKVVLITPSVFIFYSGNAKDGFINNLLNSEHFHILWQKEEANEVFENTTFLGGLVISCYDNKSYDEPMNVFIRYEELKSIADKVKEKKEELLEKYIYTSTKFNLDMLYEDYPEIKEIASRREKDKRIANCCIEYPCFHDKEEKDDVSVMGRMDNKRVQRFVNEKYIEREDNIDCYKVIVPAQNGSNAIQNNGQSTKLIGNPILSYPREGYSQAFIGIGRFDTKEEAENCLKYIKTKFARCLLGIKKVTKHCTKEKWGFIPMQNFTHQSDVDWSGTIKEIDERLYKKYNLNEEEIEFIERNIKEI